MAEKDKGVSPVVAGIAGAVIGVAAAAGAVALSDKKNRKKIEKITQDLRAGGAKAIERLKQETEKLQKALEKHQEIEESPKKLKSKTVK